VILALKITLIGLAVARGLSILIAGESLIDKAWDLAVMIWLIILASFAVHNLH
jgi:hypothetical protein